MKKQNSILAYFVFAISLLGIDSCITGTDNQSHQTYTPTLVANQPQNVTGAKTSKSSRLYDSAKGGLEDAAWFSILGAPTDFLTDVATSVLWSWIPTQSQPDYWGKLDAMDSKLDIISSKLDGLQDQLSDMNGKLNELYGQTALTNFDNDYQYFYQPMVAVLNLENDLLAKSILPRDPYIAEQTQPGGYTSWAKKITSPCTLSEGEDSILVYNSCKNITEFNSVFMIGGTPEKFSHLYNNFSLALQNKDKWNTYIRHAQDLLNINDSNNLVTLYNSIVQRNVKLFSGYYHGILLLQAINAAQAAIYFQGKANLAQGDAFLSTIIKPPFDEGSHIIAASDYADAILEIDQRMETGLLDHFDEIFVNTTRSDGKITPPLISSFPSLQQFLERKFFDDDEENFDNNLFRFCQVKSVNVNTNGDGLKIGTLSAKCNIAKNLFKNVYTQFPYYVEGGRIKAGAINFKIIYDVNSHEIKVTNLNLNQLNAGLQNPSGGGDGIRVDAIAYNNKYYYAKSVFNGWDYEPTYIWSAINYKIASNLFIFPDYVLTGCNPNHSHDRCRVSPHISLDHGVASIKYPHKRMTEIITNQSGYPSFRENSHYYYLLRTHKGNLFVVNFNAFGMYLPNRDSWWEAEGNRVNIDCLKNDPTCERNVHGTWSNLRWHKLGSTKVFDEVSQRYVGCAGHHETYHPNWGKSDIKACSGDETIELVETPD